MLTAEKAGLHIDWVNDEDLGLGSIDSSPLAGYDAVLVRSRSYTRGGLVATLVEADGTPS